MDETLLEREAQASTLRDVAERALAGRGGVAVLEGSAGLGKTALLRELRAELADRDEAVVLSALGSELEREFPYGVVRQLFEPIIVRADASRRARLLGGAAELAATVVGAAPLTPDAGGDAAFATLHGLYWFVAALADERPLVIVADDIHWADAPSLRFLDFLARRVDELPVLVCVGLRPGEPGAEVDLLGRLADGPHATLIALAPLTATGAGALVTDAFGDDVDAGVVTAATEATGGNPLLLRELIRTLSQAGTPPTAAAVREAVPSSVARSVDRRLRALDADTRRVAHALAVLGDSRGLDLVAAVAGLDPIAATHAVDRLRSAALVQSDPPRFTHPLLRAAVAESVPAAQRAALHRDAAARLRDVPGASEELVLHLLAAPPTGEGWVVDVLRDSAHRALAEGAADAAVRRLRRALEEFPAHADGRDALVLETATAAVTAGDPDLLGLLAEAARSEDPRVAGPALGLEIVVHSVTAGEGMAVTVASLEAVIDRLGPEDAVLSDRLLAQVYGAYVVDTRLADQRRRLIAEISAAPGERLLPVLVYEAAAGDASAAEVVDLARRALAASPLTTAAMLDESTPFWAVIGVLTAEGGEVADAALRDAEAIARRSGTRIGAATAGYMRCEWALAYGAADGAEMAAREALDLWAEAGLITASGGSRISLARALVRLGRLDEADAELDAVGDLEHRFIAAPYAAARGELRLAQGRYADAVAALEDVRAFCVTQGWRRLAMGTPAPHLARALAGAGDREAARALAEAEVAEGDRRGAHMLTAEAYVALGHALDGDAALEAFAAAAKAPTAATHVRASAHAELGAALRRGNRRIDARAALNQARELAQRSTSRRIFDWATEELLLAGGRPRRTALSGVESLTPSERRVAERAAAGLNNREIAEALFVTRKTVEYTLGRAFAKLDVKSRTQLAALFNPQPPSRGSDPLEAT